MAISENPNSPSTRIYKVKKAMAPLYSEVTKPTIKSSLKSGTTVYGGSPMTVTEKGVSVVSKKATTYIPVVNSLFKITGFMLDTDLERVLTDEQKALEDQAKREKEIVSNIADASLDDQLLDVLISQAVSTSGNVDASTRLFGQPFQFSESTDLRIFDSTLAMGRKYTETFIAEAPVVSIMPGNSNFLPNMTKQERDDLLSYWKSAGNDATSTDFLQQVLSEESRFFEFTSDYVSYMQYVNLMCRMSSIYMGLGDTTMPIKGLHQKSLRVFDWKNYRYNKIDLDGSDTHAKSSPFEIYRDLADDINIENFITYTKELATGFTDSAKNIFQSVVGERNYVDFYVDPGTSFQESSNNQSVQSRLSSHFESAQALGKEMYFYGGMMANDDGQSGIFNLAASAGTMFTDVLKAGFDLVGGGIASKLTGAANTVIKGGNVMFPEIWGDSAYNKSYQITINLISPYGTKESVYLHILVPLFHLMGLALPRQISANGFAHPFMVKVSAKGWFNCEMGMVDSISVEKVQGSYTVNGVPTEMTVTLSIRDLYSDLMMTSSTKPGLFYANRGLSNWLSVTSGLDVTQPAYKEKWNAILWSLASVPLDVPDVFHRFLQSINNKIAPFFFME